MQSNDLKAKEIFYISRDGLQLTLHAYLPQKTKAVAFYIHGIQSHAGWLFEVAPDLQKDNIAVFILDRRGSGLSEGLRGDIPNLQSLFDDYIQALKKIKSLYPEQPLTLIGHSLGGSILAGLLCLSNFNIKYDAVVFCASALGKLHHKYSEAERSVLLNSQSTTLVNTNLKIKDFTDMEFYRTFMANDQLCCREVTERSYAALIELESHYLNKKAILQKPSVYISSTDDPLVDSTLALKIFYQLNGFRGINIALPSNKHYFWFTDQREPLTMWLSHYILTSGYQTSP